MLDKFLKSKDVYSGQGAEQLIDLKVINFVDNIFYPSGFISIKDIYLIRDGKQKYDQFITKIIPIFNSQQLKDKLGDGLYKKIEDLFRTHRRLRHKYFNIVDEWTSNETLKAINRILAKKLI